MINSENISIYRILKFMFAIYMPLTLFEFAMVGRTGSLLKFFGLCIMGVYLIYVFSRHNNSLLLINKKILILAIWLLWDCFTYLWTPNPNTGSYYLLAVGNMVSLVYIVSKLQWRNKEINFVQITYILGSVLFSLLMISSGELYHGAGIRYTLFIWGHEIDPNNIAGLLLPGCIFSLNRILEKHNAIFYGVCMTIILYACVLAASRGGLLGIMFGFSIYYLIYALNKGEKKKTFNALVSIVIVLIAYWVIVNQVDTALINRLNLSNLTADEGSGRIELWKTGLQLFMQKPIWGWGIGAYSGLTGSGMHNQFLIVLMESGLIGFMLFITALWMYAKKLFKYRSAVGLAILFGAFVIIFFLDAYQKKYFWNGILFCEMYLSMYKK